MTACGCGLNVIHSHDFYVSEHAQGKPGFSGMTGQKGDVGPAGRDGQPGLDGFPGVQVSLCLDEHNDSLIHTHTYMFYCVLSNLCPH